MMNELEIQKENVGELLRLINENPSLPVVMWIDSEGITTEYDYWRGYIGKAKIIEITSDIDNDHYIQRENDAYTDCYNYYNDIPAEWDEKKIEEKAKAIPWEKVISVNVGIT